MKLYGLMFKGEMLGFSAYANIESDISYELYPGGIYVWTTLSKEVADNVANNSSSWYNASYDTPTNPYAGKCEVVEFIMEGK